MKIGCHVSISGGIEKSPRRAAEMGCECFQIFTRSPRGGKAPAISAQTAGSFASGRRELGLGNCYVHTPYIINLASGNDDIRKKSVQMVVEDIKRCDCIGASCAVTHIGTSAGMKRDEAIEKTVLSLNEITDQTRGAKSQILIENSAGQGLTLGSAFEEIAGILDKTSPAVGVCLDTAHLFAAGYEMRREEGWEKTFENINATFSAEKVRLIHCNDSKTTMGSRKDRHEHIGKGEIGINGFEILLSCSAFAKVDLIVETPPGKSPEDVKILCKIREKKPLSM